MDLTTEAIKDISVAVVENFVNNKVPLNEGIAKQASEMEMNSDQVKRVVEATNTIAYLTLQKSAEDKTFEFPVADYNGVLGVTAIATKPDGTILAAETEAGIKQATLADEFNAHMSEKHEWVRQEYFRNKAQLEKLAIDQAGLALDLQHAAVKLQKEQYLLEKLAEVCDEETFGPIKALVGISKEAKLSSRVFVTSELRAVEELVGMYKRAKELIAETAEREDFQKRASAVSAIGGAFKGLKADAGHIVAKPLLGTVGGVAGGIGLGVGGTAKGVVGAAKGFGKQKAVDPLNAAFAVFTEPKPSSNVWDNLQGTQKRF